jgi:hypothetical protein
VGLVVVCGSIVGYGTPIRETNACLHDHAHVNIELAMFKGPATPRDDKHTMEPVNGLNQDDVRAALLNQERTIKKLQLKLANALEHSEHTNAECDER